MKELKTLQSFEIGKPNLANCRTCLNLKMKLRRIVPFKSIQTKIVRNDLGKTNFVAPNVAYPAVSATGHIVSYVCSKALLNAFC